MMRSKFDEQLDRLNKEMMKMGSAIEDSIRKAVDALVKQDAELAKKVMLQDEEIDREQKTIESICFNLLIQQQPVAKDLRTITAALKMVTDMERIGDQAADIGEITIKLANQPYIKKLEHINQMASETMLMLIRSIEAYVEKDMDKARKVIAYDDVVDAFKSGTVDAVNAGTQRAATIMTSNYADNFASCPIPGEKEGESAPAYVAGQTLAIGKYAQDPEMAMDFIKFYLSEENQVQWVSANCMPVRTGVFDDESVKENEMYDSMQMWSEYAKTGEITFYPADYTELCIKLVKAVQNVVFQDADAKTELDEVAEWYNNK